jgi:Transposase, Mutator family
VGDDTLPAPGALRVDEGKLRGHVDEVVRSSVEETLNGLLDAEADWICGAQRYERSAGRVDTRAGHYERTLETKAGEVRLRVPKLRRLPFETAIIERYKRREASVEMYLAGVSVRRVEDITEALWGTRVSSGTVSIDVVRSCTTRHHRCGAKLRRVPHLLGRTWLIEVDRALTQVALNTKLGLSQPYPFYRSSPGGCCEH